MAPAYSVAFVIKYIGAVALKCTLGITWLSAKKKKKKSKTSHYGEYEEKEEWRRADQTLGGCLSGCVSLPRWVDIPKAATLCSPRP